MKSKAYLLVFEGMADWEPAFAMCEINKQGKFDVVTVGFSDAPVTTMGGLKVVPGTTIDDVTPSEAGIFVLPGGDMWEQETHENLIMLLHQLHAADVPIGALCGATLEIARAGLTRGTRHTSNSKGYLKAMVPEYGDEEFYVNELAVTGNNIITASGLGNIEFAREVIKQLNIYDEDETGQWFDMFKHAVLPSNHA